MCVHARIEVDRRQFGIEGRNPGARALLGPHNQSLSNNTSNLQPSESSRPLPECLRDNLAFWEEFCDNKFVLSIIRDGYRLKWKEGPVPSTWKKDPKLWKTGPPPPCRKKNGEGCYKYESFVDEAVAKLLNSGVTQIFPEEDAHCILGMNVDDKKGEQKLRLVINGRPVNEHEDTPTFKMETLHREGRDVLQGMKFGGCLDVASAFHNVLMHKSAYKYLCFKWKGIVYCFKSLPFGIASAPWVWTQISKEPVKVFRSNGISVIHYMDDFPSAALTAEKARRDFAFLIQFLRKCGFKLELEKKCIGWDNPLSRFTALGFDIDLENQKFVVPEKKILALKDLIKVLQDVAQANHNLVDAKKVSSVAGRVVSMSLALGGVARMRTRCLYKCIGVRETAKDWRAPCLLTKGAHGELRFWVEQIDRLNGRAIAQVYPPRHIEMCAATDAGDKRIGGFIQLPPDVSPDVRAKVVAAAKESGATCAVAHDVEDCLDDGVDVSYSMGPKERARSSTWRELFGVLRILQCFASLLRGLTVRLYVDNVGTAFSLGGKVQGQSQKGKLISFVESFYGGSRIEENQELVAEIVDLAVEYNFDIDCQWIPRELNKRADASTHITAVHDFKLCAEAFEKLEDRWGIHDIDRFACPENVLVRSGLYNSRFLEPGMKYCRGIDALAQNDWLLYNNYVHPHTKCWLLLYIQSAVQEPGLLSYFLLGSRPYTGRCCAHLMVGSGLVTCQ